MRIPNEAIQAELRAWRNSLFRRNSLGFGQHQPLLRPYYTLEEILLACQIMILGQRSMVASTPRVGDRCAESSWTFGTQRPWVAKIHAANFW
jgi:hypothetical protein